MDRTSEFFTSVEVLRAHYASGAAASAGSTGAPPAAPPRSARPPPLPPLYHESRTLAEHMRATAGLARELYRLAQLRSLFDDPGDRINALTGEVKAALQALEGSLRSFMTEAARQRALSPAFASKHGTGLPLTGVGCPRAHWVAVADTLKAHLMGLTRVFQDALRLRAANVKDQAARRRQFARSTWAPTVGVEGEGSGSSEGAGGSSSLSGPSAGSSGTGAALSSRGAGVPSGPPLGAPSTDSRLHAPSSSTSGGSAAVTGVGAAVSHSGGALATSGGGLASPPPKDGLRRRGAVWGGAPASSQPPPAFAYGAGAGSTGTGAGPPSLLPSSSAYAYTREQVSRFKDASSRASDMRAVESTIVELGHMFTQMASLVAEQGETVSRIDADVTEAADNVSAGVAELTKYLASVNKHRAFALKLFAVLLAVIALFGLVYRR